MARNNETDLQAVTLVSAKTNLKGDIDTENDIRVDGKVNGNIKTNGRLLVGKNGEIFGNVNCKMADIEGKIDGKINVEDIISFKSTSIFDGELSTIRIMIDSGAAFNGICKTKDSNSDKKKK